MRKIASFVLMRVALVLACSSRRSRRGRDQAGGQEARRGRAPGEHREDLRSAQHPRCARRVAGRRDDARVPPGTWVSSMTSRARSQKRLRAGIAYDGRSEASPAWAAWRGPTAWTSATSRHCPRGTFVSRSRVTWLRRDRQHDALVARTPRRHMALLRHGGPEHERALLDDADGGSTGLRSSATPRSCWPCGASFKRKRTSMPTSGRLRARPSSPPPMSSCPQPSGLFGC